jgi:hypothetical protein
MLPFDRIWRDLSTLRNIIVRTLYEKHPRPFAGGTGKAISMNQPDHY